MCSGALVHESKRRKATSLHKECVHCLVYSCLKLLDQSMKCDFRIKWCSSNPCKACKEWIINQEVRQPGFGIPYFWHLHFSPAWFRAVQKWCFWEVPVCEPDMEPELDSVCDQDFWIPAEQNLAPLRWCLGHSQSNLPKNHWMWLKKCGGSSTACFSSAAAET